MGLWTLESLWGEMKREGRRGNKEEKQISHGKRSFYSLVSFGLQALRVQLIKFNMPALVMDPYKASPAP